jgi:hypothetical protein
MTALILKQAAELQAARARWQRFVEASPLLGLVQKSDRPQASLQSLNEKIQCLLTTQSPPTN